MRKYLFLSVLFLVAACGGRDDKMEYCGIAYSDAVSFIVQGYQCHWEGMEPSEMGLSDVYHYESLYAGTQEIDINADDVPEMLLGDQFEDGSYALYDIYTFNRKTGETIHLLSGGERDTFVINADGTIIERGSNSATDSFEKYYELKGVSLVELKKAPASDALMQLSLDPFVRYVAPTSYVVLKEGSLLGRLYKSFEDHYVVEIQDTVSIPKDNVEVQLWSAWDGKGVVYLTEPGGAEVYEKSDTASPVVGEAVYIEGYCPETYKCLGYLPGWFKISFASAEGYVQEEYCSWDFVDRF